MNILENEVIRLRALEPCDIELLYIWENDIGAWQAGETIVPFSRYILQQYVANASFDIYEAKQLRLMIDAKDNDIPVTVGTIDLFDFNPYHKRAGVGILIYSPQNRQKGYATQALKLLIDYAFTVLNLHQLYCNVAAGNQKSLTLFRNSGFEITGLKREWIYNGENWENEYLLQLLADN
ncbi:MAG: GNAT family N-acetyltransferase [Prevotellaceae bacterium]|jgi:diamine N-acetyltransferase|nr:GNAT family N-acetyltransferase [Prevotellaceae bacterium]